MTKDVLKCGTIDCVVTAVEVPAQYGPAVWLPLLGYKCVWLLSLLHYEGVLYNRIPRVHLPSGYCTSYKTFQRYHVKQTPALFLDGDEPSANTSKVVFDVP